MWENTENGFEFTFGYQYAVPNVPKPRRDYSKGMQDYLHWIGRKVVQPYFEGPGIPKKGVVSCIRYVNNVLCAGIEFENFQTETRLSDRPSIGNLLLPVEFLVLFEHYQNSLEILDENSSEFYKPESLDKLRIGDTVVWFGGLEPQTGVVKWIGRFGGDLNPLKAWIEMDDPTAINPTEQDTGSKFGCSPQSGRYLPVDELILFQDYVSDGISNDFLRHELPLRSKPKKVWGKKLLRNFKKTMSTMTQRAEDPDLSIEEIGNQSDCQKTSEKMQNPERSLGFEKLDYRKTQEKMQNFERSLFLEKPDRRKTRKKMQIAERSPDFKIPDRRKTRGLGLGFNEPDRQKTSEKMQNVEKTNEERNFVPKNPPEIGWNIDINEPPINRPNSTVSNLENNIENTNDFKKFGSWGKLENKFWEAAFPQNSPPTASETLSNWEWERIDWDLRTTLPNNAFNNSTFEDPFTNTYNNVNPQVRGSPVETQITANTSHHFNNVSNDDEMRKAVVIADESTYQKPMPYNQELKVILETKLKSKTSTDFQFLPYSSIRPETQNSRQFRRINSDVVQPAEKQEHENALIPNPRFNTNYHNPEEAIPNPRKSQPNSAILSQNKMDSLDQNLNKLTIYPETYLEGSKIQETKYQNAKAKISMKCATGHQETPVIFDIPGKPVTKIDQKPPPSTDPFSQNRFGNDLKISGAFLSNLEDRCSFARYQARTQSSFTLPQLQTQFTSNKNPNTKFSSTRSEFDAQKNPDISSKPKLLAKPKLISKPQSLSKPKIFLTPEILQKPKMLQKPSPTITNQPISPIESLPGSSTLFNDLWIQGVNSINQPISSIKNPYQEKSTLSTPPLINRNDFAKIEMDPMDLPPPPPPPPEEQFEYPQDLSDKPLPPPPPPEQLLVNEASKPPPVPSLFEPRISWTSNQMVASNPGIADLLKEIQEGRKLKNVGIPIKKKPCPPQNNLSTIFNAIKERRLNMESSDDENEHSGDNHEDEEEWN